MAGIYIHLPFCRTKCAYCDFFSKRSEPTDIVKYLDVLSAEWFRRKNELDGEPIETIYLGGGTPSVLTPHQLRQILSLFPTDDALEITLEVNPDDMNPQYCQGLRDITSINRISMGVQSLDNGQLKSVGRRHTADGAITAFQNLREAGFTNISLDLIYGLPGQTLESWKYSLEKTLQLEPEHLSAYLLSYEKGTPLYRLLEKGYIKETSEDRVIEMYSALCELTSCYGYEHYEISNFARSGFRSKHNSSYWTSSSYLGLGASAHSLTRKVRSHNTHDIHHYKNHIDVENKDELFNDVVLTRLRTIEGLDIKELAETFGKEFTIELIDSARRCGLEVDKLGKLKISEHRWIVSDRIILELLRV